MLDRITSLAPAKINLGLKVYSKRADGYHDIESIFTTVNLCDHVTVSLLDKDNECIVRCGSLVLPENNTFVMAYKAFCVLTGIKRGVLVEVTKNIPLGSGLGGGSSDASSFLKSIDILFNTQLGTSDLDLLSGQVGSDVFFFTHALAECKSEADLCEYNNFTAIVRGRGEIITQIVGRSDFSLLLVLPSVSVSTKVAYTLVDKAISRRLALSGENDKNNKKSVKNGFIGDFALSLDKIYSKRIEDWSFVNDFTEPVCELYPEIGLAISALKRYGAVFADMSGSGSTVFGVFNDKSDALEAKAKLSRDWQVVLA